MSYDSEYILKITRVSSDDIEQLGKEIEQLEEAAEEIALSDLTKLAKDSAVSGLKEAIEELDREQELLVNYDFLLHDYLKSMVNERWPSFYRSNKPFEEDFAEFFAESTSWNEMTRCLGDLSRCYPEYLFEVTVVGEEYPDFQRRWFYKGTHESVVGKVVFPEMTESFKKLIDNS